MKRSKLKITKNINVKSQKGFTMQDLAIALLIITLFIGIISTLMFNVYKINIKSKLTSQMVMYSVQILEDIDKISYEEVTSELSNSYNSKFSIPEGFKIDIKVSNYADGLTNVQDLIKIVDLNISYSYLGETEEFKVTRLKIKEI